MVKKIYTPEQIINKLRGVEILISQGATAMEASRNIGVTEQTYYRWRITQSDYNKKREEFRAKQKGISDKITKLGFADEEYYLTSEYLLQLANRAYDLFLSSEAEEKRQLLKLTLQNLKLEGKKVEFELVEPFDKVFACAGSQSWLPG